MRKYYCLCLGLGLLLSACREPEIPFESKEVPFEELILGELAVKIDPFGRNPLSAQLTFESKQACELSITLLGEEPLFHDFPKAAEHQVPILGLYPGRENKIVLDMLAENGWYAQDTLSIVTDPLPDYLPEIQIVSLQAERMESGFHFSNFNRPVDKKFQKSPFLFDNKGIIRWMLDLSEFENLTFPIQRFEDGLWYLFQGNKILTFSMLGEKLREIDLGETYRPHHDLIELPNGNLVVMVNKAGTTIPTDTGAISCWGDHLIEIERTSGGLIREWDMREVLDVSRKDLQPQATGDWFHGNAVWHDPSDNGLIISGRNQGVVKVSQDNELLWIMAPHRAWGQAGINGDGQETAAYLLKAVDASGSPYNDSIQDGAEAHFDFDWPWGQHAPSLLPNGNIVLFDNGFERQFGQASLYSRVLEYAVDPTQMSIRQLRAYGADRGQGLYSRVISNASWLPDTDNLLMMPGLIREGVPPQARIVEVSGLNSEVVFEAALIFKNSGGDGSNTWGNIDAVYRSGRMNLYP
ncbi:MAG: aryl-sulfate sulfotransferase [Bacteroidota bacterium]